MQGVSEEYRESMKSPLRERGYIRVVFGSLSSVAQNTAVIESEDEAEISDTSRVFRNGLDDFLYAAFDKNYTKLDGSMHFPPIDTVYGDYRDKCFKSNQTVSDEPCVLTINFSTSVLFDYVSFNFGENYPTDFDLEDSEGNVYEYRNNTERIFVADEDFESTTSLTLTILSMKNEDTCFRLYSVNFGLGVEYQNDMIINSNLEGSMSPINEFLPQVDFSLDLKNEDHYFDTDNPKSILNNFDRNTKMTVYYGYELPNSHVIEWINGATVYCQNWTSDQNKATIYAKDILQIKDGEYNNGTFESVSLYDLAVDVFQTMGITEYSISPLLSSIYTTNPIPRVSCKAALQIIANAAQSKLWLKRNGLVAIGESSYSYELVSNGDSFGDLGSIMQDSQKYVYASFDKDFTKLDGSRYFTPINFETGTFLTTGYVSTYVSNEYGEFSTNPTISMIKNDNFPVNSITLTFGEAIVSDLTVKLYDESTVIETVEVEDNESQTVEINFQNPASTKIEIEFTKTSNPYNRVYVYGFSFVAGGSYIFDNIDLMTYPQFTKYERVKEIVVPYYSYYKSATSEVLMEEELAVESTSTRYIFYMTEPCSNYSCSVVSGGGSASVIDSGAYYVVLQFSSTGTKKITISGKKYTVVEQKEVKTLNNDGKIVQWENPLINSKQMAANLAEWLKDYYEAEGEYTFESRGNPELDVNDAVQQVNYLGVPINTVITRLGLGFDGAFKGNVTTLKTGE